MSFGINLIVVQLVLYVSTTFNTQTKKIDCKRNNQVHFLYIYCGPQTIIDFLWYMQYTIL